LRPRNNVSGREGAGVNGERRRLREVLGGGGGSLLFLGLRRKVCCFIAGWKSGRYVSS